MPVQDGDQHRRYQQHRCVIFYLIQNNIIVRQCGYGINLVGAQGQRRSSSSASIRSSAAARTHQPARRHHLSGGGGEKFSNSIVYGNAANGGALVSGHDERNFRNVVTGAAESRSDPTFSKLGPDLDESFRMRATSDNTACCIDKITSIAGETLPSRDIDGTTRPQNGKVGYRRIGTEKMAPSVRLRICPAC